MIRILISGRPLLREKAGKRERQGPAREFRAEK
jgi:hypothetical protein